MRRMTWRAISARPCLGSPKCCHRTSTVEEEPPWSDNAPADKCAAPGPGKLSSEPPPDARSPRLAPRPPGGVTHTATAELTASANPASPEP